MDTVNISWLLASLSSGFHRTVLRVPLLFIVVTLGVTTFFAYFIKDFQLDASADSIVLENDTALRDYNETRKRFGTDDSLIILVTPAGDPFSPETLSQLKTLSDDILGMPNIVSCSSILNAPLFFSPRRSPMALADNVNTLEAGADPALAQKELMDSPLYRDNLVSADGKTYALVATFTQAPAWYTALYDTRTRLRDLTRTGNVTPEQQDELETVEAAYSKAHAARAAERRADIETLRAILAKHRSIGTLHMGGVPMISADIISYVESDMYTFGVAVVSFVVLILAVLFRTLEWVLLPTLTALSTLLIMLGYLGYSGWLLTIVTSNFTSLLLIITIAMCIHIATRFQELYTKTPDKPKPELILETCQQMAIPCLYTSLTTMVGFGSLIVSQIRPVMDFGLMMVGGITVAYTLCFVFLPAAMLLFPKGTVPAQEPQESVQSPTALLARFTEQNGRLVLIVSSVLGVVCVAGILQLQVENRFIDYFKQDTAIYQGMTEIDTRLGGTTPLEVVLTGEGQDFWLKQDNRAKLEEIHHWLEELPETGKVLSPITLVRVAEQLFAPMLNGRPLPEPFIKMALEQMPEDVRVKAVYPYITPELDQARIAMRVFESSHALQRKDLLAKIDAYLAEQGETASFDTRVTGIFVLYNNMLQSLFTSQVLTIGAVFGAIWVMFFIVFRSVKLATIAIIPNILPVILVLGLLGWSGLPLDIMTIMTAAVALGIAVDFAIHYVFRFRVEFAKDRHYWAAMHRSHNSIGRALWYTSITIIGGFSILAVSNFLPTIYFGLFTGLAMVVALLASMTLLPLLLVSWMPFGPEGEPLAGMDHNKVS